MNKREFLGVSVVFALRATLSGATGAFMGNVGHRAIAANPEERSQKEKIALEAAKTIIAKDRKATTWVSGLLAAAFTVGKDMGDLEDELQITEEFDGEYLKPAPRYRLRRLDKD